MFETVLTCPNYVLMSQSYPLALAAIFRDRFGFVEVVTSKGTFVKNPIEVVRISSSAR